MAASILTSYGFQRRFNPQPNDPQRTFIYKLRPVATIDQVKEGILKEQSEKNRAYNIALETLEADLQAKPFLIKQNGHLKLYSEEKALTILREKAPGITEQKAFQILGINREPKEEALKPVGKGIDSIKTAKELVEAYNSSNQKELGDLFEKVLQAFKTQEIIRAPQVKTLVDFARCADKDTRDATLDLLLTKWEPSEFKSRHYAYGLKHFLDNLDESSLKPMQNGLLSVFNKCITRLKNIPQTSEEVNHEIEPLTELLISTSRALVHSGLESLKKDTKNKFYKDIKEFYTDEKYEKRFRALASHTNYLLVFETLWTLQHLIRISSDEHKALTAARKAAHGAYAFKTLVGGPLKAAVQLYQQGTLPDESLIPELKLVYKHGKKAFGIKDIRRPWYDVLELTESALINYEINVTNLDKVYKEVSVGLVDPSFSERLIQPMKEAVGKDIPTLECTKEFAFGFIKQLSEIASSHQDIQVRERALEIIAEVCQRNPSHQAIWDLSFTTLHHIIQKKDDPLFPKAQETHQSLDGNYRPLIQKYSLNETIKICRESKYPCLALIEEDPSLLEAAKKSLAAETSRRPFPKSEVDAGTTQKTNYKKKVTASSFVIGPAESTVTKEDLLARADGANAMHAPRLEQSDQLDTYTKLGDTVETNFEDDFNVTGEFRIGGKKK